MKITILGTAYPYRGGIAAFNERLAREFAAEGDLVELITFTLQYPSFLFPGKTQYSSDAAPADLSIRRMVNSCNPLNWIKVGNKIKRERPDMLVIGFWIPMMAPALGTIARIARSNKHTRVISILHNVIPHEKRAGDKVFAQYFINNIDGAVAMSKAVFNDAADLGAGGHLALSPHPLYDHYGEPLDRETAAKFLKLGTKARYMLFFGLIRDYKGLDWLLEAFAASGLKNRGVKLIVAGEFYGNGDKYHRLAQDLGLEECIAWATEFIPDSMVKYYFSMADIIVQPYKSATQSGVTQIGFHFRKPMLVTNVGGLAEIIPDGKVGYAVDPAPESIAKALCDFFDNERQYSFDQGIEDEVKKYSWSNMTNSIKELI